jgi:lipoyl(octanoyl) transferase
MRAGSSEVRAPVNAPETANERNEQPLTTPTLIHYRWLGRVDYDEGLAEQRRCFEAVAGGSMPILLACEHNPVFTLGRRGSRNEILCAGEIPVVPIDRGGRATYHGPGQAVIYPIIKLETFNLGVREYIRTLEESTIRWLDKAGITADRDLDNPGVWLGDAKIAAVGVHVGRGITTHGMAINLDLDLAVYERFLPCGLPFRRVTRIADHMAANLPTTETLAREIGYELVNLLGANLVHHRPDDA